MGKDSNTPNRRRFLKSFATGSTVTLATISGCLSGGGGGGDDTSGNNGSSQNQTKGQAGGNGSASSIENLPSGRIQMIVPFDAGGGTDRTARKLASMGEEMSNSSFYVSNVTGGSGSTGFRRAANAKPDGTTLGILTVEICTISHLGISDVTPNGFVPVMQYNFDPASLTVPKDAPYDTVKEFIDHVKDSQDSSLQVSNSGIGAIWHLSAAKFAEEVGISDSIEHVGYDGAAPATKAVVSGEVDATAASAAEVAPQVKDGPLKILGVMGEDRVGILPDVKTFKQQGVDVKGGAWRGLGLPADTPNKIAQAHSKLFTSIYESSEFKEFMKKNGFGMVYRSSEEYGKFMDSEYERFGKLIKNLDIEQ